jgi:uncharacterized protein YerC
MAFRDQEIHTLDELIECHLTEEDLRDVLHIEPLYARKTLARYIREVDPHETVSTETEMQPLIGALINNIQAGLEGDEEAEEEDDEVYSFAKPSSSLGGGGGDLGEGSPGGEGERSDEAINGDYTE